MVVYRNVAHPDPLDRVAEAFEEIASGIKSLSDPDMLVEIAKKAGLTGKEPEKVKEPVVLDVVRKEE